VSTLRPYGLQPTRLLCPWGFPGKNTGVGYHFFLKGILPILPGIKPMSPALAGRFFTIWATREVDDHPNQVMKLCQHLKLCHECNNGKILFHVWLLLINSVFEIHLLYFRSFFFFSPLYTILIYEYVVVYSIIFLWMDSWVAYNLGLLLLRLMWIFLSVVNICIHVSWAIYTSWGFVERSVICKVYSMCKDIASPSAVLPVSGCLACFLFWD